jgi:shikimate 5-dehydrogenase
MAFNDYLNFEPTLEKFSQEAAPFHVLLSGFLRQSKTFEMYDALARDRNIQSRLIPFELPDDGSLEVEQKLLALIDLLRHESNFRSIMVSDPFKQRLHSVVDRITERASACGAINVLLKRESVQGSCTVDGDNFDGEAFVTGIGAQEGIDFNGKKMVFFGCGGVSSAVSSRLARVLTKIALVDLRPGRANTLRESLLRQNSELSVEILTTGNSRDFREYDYLYNGTGLGKSNDSSPIDQMDLFNTSGIAFDANYTPSTTPFLVQLKELGYRPINGLSHMLACTTMHLTAVTGAPVAFESVNRAYEQIAVVSP